MVLVSRLKNILMTTATIGSTVPYVVERIVAQGPIVNKDRVFIPTGKLTMNGMKRV